MAKTLQDLPPHPVRSLLPALGVMEDLGFDRQACLKGTGILLSQLEQADARMSLQQELANTEDRIQAARRFYNGNVRDLNTRIEVIPSNLIASAFHFTKEEYFEVESSVIRKVVDVNFSE